MAKITLTGTQTVNLFCLRHNEYTGYNDVINTGQVEKPLKMVISEKAISAVYVDSNLDGTFTDIPLKVKFTPEETKTGSLYSGTDMSGGKYDRIYWMNTNLFWDTHSNKQVLENVDIQTWDNGATGFIQFEYKCRCYPGSRDFYRDIKTIQFTLDEKSKDILMGMLKQGK